MASIMRAGITDAVAGAPETGTTISVSGCLSSNDYTVEVRAGLSAGARRGSAGYRDRHREKAIKALRYAGGERAVLVTLWSSFPRRWR